MEPAEYEELLRALVRIAARQDLINQDMRTAVQELRTFNRAQVGINDRLTLAIERLDVTQARIETLLNRALQSGDNGQEV